MPTNAFDTDGEVDAASAGGVLTPQAALSRMRAESARDTALLPTQIMEAMLTLCGEEGYRNVSVQDVIERYGGYRLQFYRLFGSKAECYAAAYDVEAERLCGALMDVLDRLSRSIDSARRETVSRHSPPPVTAAFIVRAIESSVVTAVSRGAPEEFAEATPGLADLFGSYYYDD